MTRRSPLALAVLALLFEEPMHPYAMQRRITERGKDRVVYVGQRATLYKTIERLHRDGLVEPRETSRDAGRPERTVYEITPAGRETVLRWEREMLSAPRDEFPEFPAAVAHLTLLDAADVRRQLEARRDGLKQALAEQRDMVTNSPEGLPRVFLLEEEYLAAVLQAELTWISSVIDELSDGRISWTAESLAALAARFNPPIPKDD
jgi:DNA-binding PadR family transcriptional regulator